jgi:hypothetical protein
MSQKEPNDNLVSGAKIPSGTAFDEVYLCGHRYLLPVSKHCNGTRMIASRVGRSIVSGSLL